jgi:hypothetical protein
MHLISDQLAGILTGSHVTRLRAESWFAGDMIAEIPVASGSLGYDSSIAIPENLSITVPRVDRGVNYTPANDDDPLNRYGQLLRVEYGVDIEFGVTEYVPLGWFLIDTPRTEGDVVSVRANGLLHLIEEAGFVAPFEPTGNLTDVVRALVEPALTVEFTGLTDRAVPQGMAFEKDRLGGLFEVLDAWPAEAKVDENGTLQVFAPEDPDVIPATVWDLSDASDGTVMRWQGGGSRADTFNIVVARGEDSAGTRVQGVANDLDADSPLRIGGPFNPLPVPFEFFSPLLTTVDQCRTAARTILNRKRRTTFRTIECETIPNPGLQTGDAVSFSSASLNLSGVAIIDAFELPLIAGAGSMRLRLRVVSSG